MAWEVFTGTWYSLIFTCIFSGYRLFKFVLFLAGFLIAFFFSYIMCTEHLSDELSGTVLEYKDQVKYLKILKKFYTWGQFQNRPCAPHPSPLSGKPPGIWLLSKFWSNSLVCWQFRWSNTPPASASRSVKSPIQQRLFNKFPIRQTIYWSVSVPINQPKYRKSWKAVLQRFVHSNKIVHSRKRGLFQRLSNAPTKQRI